MSATDTVSELHAAARELAAEGVAVVPLHTVKDGKCSCNRDCPKPGKHPRTLHGKDDATTDTEQIDTWWSRWPDSNVGINTELSGLVVPDIDPRHGGVETFAALEREHGALPADTPRARSGGGGEHIYLAANDHRVKTGAGAIGPGVDLTYLIVAPPSVHESGARYEWLVPFEKRVPAPAWVFEAAGARANGHKTTEPVADRIPHGQQHNELVRRAGSMRRWGASAGEIDAALQVMNKERLERPGDPAEISRIAESMMRYKPVDREVWAAAQTGELPGGAGPIRLRWWREEDIEEVSWAWPNRIPLGSLSDLTGDGGVGKDTLADWIKALLTRGELPGNFQGTPINILVIGVHEDGVGDTSTPRVKAAGGDVTRIANLETELDREINLVRDIKEIERLVREHDFRFVYLNQPLDNFPVDSNSHVGQDVRHALLPMARLARRYRLGVLFTAHASYSSAGQRGIREAGSVQFGNVVRSSQVLGYHPNPALRDYRVFARRKWNVGDRPPALIYTVEEREVVNPVTGLVVTARVPVDFTEDPTLLARDVQFAPPGEPEELNEERIERALRALGGDGKWHSKKEAAGACEGVAGSSFDKAFPDLGYIERETRGKETWWRLKR